MKDKFQETYDQIKAPEELKNHVLMQMMEDKPNTEGPMSPPPQKTFHIPWRYPGLAAAILLCFSLFYFQTGNTIYKTPLKDGEYLQAVELQDGYLQFLENGSLISLTPNAGVIGKEEPDTDRAEKEVYPIKGGGTITIERSANEHIKPIPEQLRSHMGQQELVLTTAEDSGQKSFSAEFEKEGVLYRISGEKVTQKQFIDFLAEQIDNGI